MASTIHDVARHLGISRSTVSYALSGKRPVSAEMKRRIDAAIKELGYWPSATAQALATARTNTVALLAPMADNATPDVVLQYVNGVVQALRRHGYDTLLVAGDEAFNSLERLTRSKQADGFVLLDVEEDDPRLEGLRKAGMPSVLIGMPTAGDDFDRVDLDWEMAGSLLVSQVSGLGHREVCLVGAPEEAHALHMTYAVRFLEGAMNAAADRGVELSVIASSIDPLETSSRVRAELARRPGTSAFIIQHETSVISLRAALSTLNLTIPEDVSVAGITSKTVGAQLMYPVTGIENPSDAVTARAVDLLINRLQSSSSPPTPVTELIPPTLTDRGTTAPTAG